MATMLAAVVSPQFAMKMGRLIPPAPEMVLVWLMSRMLPVALQVQCCCSGIVSVGGGGGIGTLFLSATKVCSGSPNGPASAAGCWAGAYPVGFWCCGHWTLNWVSLLQLPHRTSCPYVAMGCGGCLYPAQCFDGKAVHHHVDHGLGHLPPPNRHLPFQP